MTTPDAFARLAAAGVQVSLRRALLWVDVIASDGRQMIGFACHPSRLTRELDRIADDYMAQRSA